MDSVPPVVRQQLSALRRAEDIQDHPSISDSTLFEARLVVFAEPLSLKNMLLDGQAVA